MAKKIAFIALLIWFLFQSLVAQEYVQQVRGIVTDLHTGIPLPGATVVLTSLNEQNGTSTDANGRFTINNVPVGRHSIIVSFIGYKPYEINNFSVTSGREVVFEITLEESVQSINEVVIRHTVNKEMPLNEMATVSARMFTIEETDRYAGSIGDPARMASNFAGVGTLNDQSNDIVIRGNSPFGLLWMLEGVDIPNPNHFGAMGATGGPIGMLNNNTLSNSDFFTGAFPAQYGNALSGVFDLSLRQGNTTKYEFLGQIAFNGFEVGIEGPISRQNHTSFIANYRYSTLGVLDKVWNLENMALMSVPYYQDLNFNATLYRGRAGRVTTFGLLGYNHISFNEDVESPDQWDREVFGQDARSETRNGTVGLTHTINFGERFKQETTFATMGIWEQFKADTLTLDNPTLSPQHRKSNNETSLFIATHSTYKLNARNIFGAGISVQPMQYSFADSIYQRSANGFISRSNYKGAYNLTKGYMQWKHNFTNELTVTTGVHLMHFTASEDISLEPRAGIRWAFSPRQAVSLAGGLHGHLAPRIYYVYQTDNPQASGNPLDFTRSLHLIAGYDLNIAQNTRLKLETYYQHHYNVLVSEDTPGWSLLNFGAEWVDMIVPSETLSNKGTGDNYGAEITLERFLSQGYYYLLTASIFDSKYKGLDGIERNTAFNSNYILNTLFGKEFQLRERNVLTLDAKVVWAGGKRYVPFTSQQVAPDMHIRIDDWDNAYKNRMDDYFRINLRVGYRINRPSSTHELAVDLYNLTNRKNIFLNIFDPITGNTRTLYQFTFMPVVMYRVQL